ncbi:hypothetical protein BDQ17DRAFT_1242359 [Cyathus striatus]|nr:hypothetical protein BDQ17DRAFT_1242359 [Cyathus striatus]
MNVQGIVDVARRYIPSLSLPPAHLRVFQRTQCTHLHPGYGFLSELPLLPEALEKYRIMFIGPSSDVLRVASDKMLSRELAVSLGVPVAPGRRVQTVEKVKSFARDTGYPVIIKALDGGGGRGIRVVDKEDGIEKAFKRCLGESPSHQLFVEKALTGPGWKHIEVQIIGDGTAVNHFWERECSVQRRFQKLIETSPSLLPRSSLTPLLNASLTLASHLSYKGLGTSEFLLNSSTSEWVFLEINPRVQVEHTITEEVNNVDLVEMQLGLFKSPPETLASLGLLDPPRLPKSFAVQLRLTAEDPARNFTLSTGTVRGVSWPAGRGVRVDTWLSSSPALNEEEEEWEVTPDYDSLLAKIIVHHQSWEGVCQLAERALGEVGVKGVKTNLGVLLGVVRHPEWRKGGVDTLWLERSLGEVIQMGGGGRGVRGLERRKEDKPMAGSSGEGILLQPGSTFSLLLSPSTESKEEKHTITLQSLTTNAFPSSLSGTVLSSFHPTPHTFSLSLSSSAAAVAGELANPRDANHVAAPMGGKVVEVHLALSYLIDGGGAEKREMVRVRRGETLLVMSVMKMESVVLAPRDGWVERVGRGVKVGEVLGEGGWFVFLLGRGGVDCDWSMLGRVRGDW